MFKYIAAYLIVELLVEVAVFNLWLYWKTKNTNLANKYWANNFNTKNVSDLSKGQLLILRTISVTRNLTIFVLILHILASFINSF